MSLVIYTKPGCPYCEKARDHYNERGIAFIDHDAQNDKERQREMLEYSGGDLTVPCIVENGAYIGSGWGDPRGAERSFLIDRQFAGYRPKTKFCSAVNY